MFLYYCFSAVVAVVIVVPRTLGVSSMPSGRAATGNSCQVSSVSPGRLINFSAGLITDRYKDHLETGIELPIIL